MALTYVTTDGTLVIPSAPASWQTAPANSGVSTTGVVLLVGEADVGPDYSSESDITQNYFGPRSFAAVQAKYGSGRLVDAYRELTAPSLDSQVRGSPTAVYILKTNKGTKAAGALGTYGTLQAKQEGSLGNLIAYSVSEKVAQVLPSLSAAYVLDTNSETISIGANGATPWALAATPGYADPKAAAIGLSNYLLTGTNQSFDKGVMVMGGSEYVPTTGLVGNFSLAIVSGNTVTITLASSVWASKPVAGQTLIIPTGSPVQGAGDQNRGFYIVLSSTVSTVTAVKVKNGDGSTPVTAPVAVGAQALLASATDLAVYDPLQFMSGKGKKRADQTGITTWSGAVSGSNFVVSLTTPLETWSTTPVQGDLCKFQRGGNYFWFTVVSATTNTVTLSQMAPTTAVSAVSAFVSEAVGASTIEFLNPVVGGISPTLVFQRSAASTGVQYYDATGVASIMSAAGGLVTATADRQVAVNITRSVDNVSESWKGGGNVVLSLGYDGNTRQPVSITGNTLTLGVAATTVDLTQFKTVGDLAAYINTLASWHAYANPLFQQLDPSTVLDHVAATTASAEDEASAANLGLTGLMPCRIKKDAYDLITAVNSSRVATFSAQPNQAGAPVVGLPNPYSITATAFMTGGAKGGTTDAAISAALAAAQLCQTNFVVTLFSQDAATDIASGDTDATSTYTIASTNAALSAHVAAASQFKARKPRQGFPSFRGTYANAKLAAQTLANFRMAGVDFLDFNTLGANGLQWFQPWMAAVNKAGMQAAGFYRPLFNKSINCSGVRQAAGDFNVNSEDQVEDALLNGLSVIRPRQGGGFSFVSDNTTYGVDQNFVLNSIQAIYVADVVAQTTSMRMEQAFVGQSFADVSPTVALAFFKGIMASLKALKLIAASSDAPSGFKNVVIDIQPPAMLVSAEVKLATGVYFVPIRFLVTQVQGTVTA